MHPKMYYAPHFIANDLALDFINSAFGAGDNCCDCLTDDAGALAWLEAAGQLVPALDIPPTGLATLARSLRDAAGRLIQGPGGARQGDAGVVNAILEAGRPVRALAVNGDAHFTLTERRRDDSAASLLQPVAAALVSLLVEGDVSQVRQCEAHDCTLRFLDVTKSGRRRWCSMAICGNRMKVAAFRARKEVR